LFDIIPVARDKIFEEMQDGVIVLDAQDRIVDINSKMKTIIQDHLNKNLKIGDSFIQYFEKEYSLISLVSNKENGKYEWNLISKTFDIKVSALFDKSTIFSGTVLLFREVTDRKVVENKLKSQTLELQQLNDLKNKLFSIISHDLRNPILSLKEIMNLLNDGVISEDELKNYLPIITKNITSTSSLLENLLNWSRSQLKGERIHAKEFNIRIASLVQIQLLERSALDKKIRIENNISEDQMVYADRDMIELVIRNLLSNAIKYCNENDNIEMTSCLQNDVVKICIKDTGVGIAEENLNNLFGMNNFSTIGTKKESGTGLGLLLCREFIEKNNGSIWVESTQGVRSEFCFTIPAHP
jgi:signal transduction histidine kinase